MITKENGNRQLAFDRQRLNGFIERVTSINSPDFNEKIIRSVEAKNEFKAHNITDLLINTALENVDEVNPQWTYDAAKIYLTRLIIKRVKIARMTRN